MSGIEREREVYPRSTRDDLFFCTFLKDNNNVIMVRVPV